MEFNYCAFIDRRTADNCTDFTDLPFDDLNGLQKIAEAALGMPYVESVRISEKTGEIDGKPWWGRHVFERKKHNVDGYYANEEQFRLDLRTTLNDDKLFDELYAAKTKYKTLTGL